MRNVWPPPFAGHASSSHLWFFHHPVANAQQFNCGPPFIAASKPTHDRCISATRPLAGSGSQRRSPSRPHHDICPKAVLVRTAQASGPMFLSASRWNRCVPSSETKGRTAVRSPAAVGVRSTSPNGEPKIVGTAQIRAAATIAPPPAT